MALIQLHHQFLDKDLTTKKTEFIAQRDINSNDEMCEFVKEIQREHPIPKDAQWLACNEKSELFIMTHKNSTVFRRPEPL